MIIINRMSAAAILLGTFRVHMMMAWCFMSLSSLFKSYRDDGRVIKALCNEAPYVIYEVLL